MSPTKIYTEMSLAKSNAKTLPCASTFFAPFLSTLATCPLLYLITSRSVRHISNSRGVAADTGRPGLVEGQHLSGEHRQEGEVTTVCSASDLQHSYVFEERQGAALPRTAIRSVDRTHCRTFRN